MMYSPEFTFTLPEALEACVEYAGLGSPFDKDARKFYEVARPGQETLRERYEFMKGTEKYNYLFGHPEKFKTEHLRKALINKEMIAMGHPVPIPAGAEKMTIASTEWSYLIFNPEHNSAGYMDRAYCALEFFPNLPEFQTKMTRRKSGPKTDAKKVLKRLYQENETVFSGLSKKQMASEILRLAIQEDRSRDGLRGFTEVNVLKALDDLRRTGA